ncbi:MAG: aspartyl-tRNA(Asn)/glutamyl-tRNA(Gln) amidotransferase subunit A [Vicingaceae bacterium]
MKGFTSLKNIQKDLQSSTVTCVELVEYYLDRIKDQKDINAFVETFDASANAQAVLVDAKIKEGKAGVLAGLIISIKDNICYEGHKLSASSKMLEGFESLYSSTVVERLLKEDAIIIGRTNCDEFAMGSSNETSFYGPVKNPLDKNKVAGGSSGGAAASVAADLCMAALGSDTGGSIRQPASFTGTVGLKPTYGRVSRHGLIAFGSSFDQIGTFTKNVDDAALITEVIAGKDEFDSTVSRKEVEPYFAEIESQKDKKQKIAYFDCYVNHEAIDPEVKKRTIEIIEKLRLEGHQVDEVKFDYLDQIVPTYYVLTTAEASSNLARYDGIHFGYRSTNATDLESTYVKSRSEGFGREVKRRIMLGTYVLSAGYYDAYYTKAQKVRRLVRDCTNEVFENYDFIISPTSPHTAFDLNAQKDDQIKMYLEDIYTVQANLAGIPAISLPLGIGSDKMPFGIQLMTSAFNEKKLLSFSKQLVNKFALTSELEKA